MSEASTNRADKASILGAKVRRYAEVEIQGRLYRFQSLNEREKSEYDAAVVEKSGEVSVKKVSQQKRRLIVLTLVDEEGTRLFTSSDLADLEEVDGGLTSALYDAAAAHCGIGKSKVADEEKNSD